MMSLGVCCVLDVAVVAAGMVVARAEPCARTRCAYSAPVIQVLATRRVVILISWLQVWVTRAPNNGETVIDGHLFPKGALIAARLAFRRAGPALAARGTATLPEFELNPGISRLKNVSNVLESTNAF